MHHRGGAPRITPTVLVEVLSSSTEAYDLDLLEEGGASGEPPP